MKLKALPGRVLVDDIERGDRIIGSIWVPNDNGKVTGIRIRWARVHAVGEGVTEVLPGQWILVEHGNWTRGVEIKPDDGGPVFTIWQVNWPEGVLAVSDQPEGTSLPSGTNIPSLTR